MNDAVEIELKFADVDLSSIVERLGELGAERLAASAFEDNVVLDRQDELFGRDEVLRLRKDRRGTRLTFKGPPSFAGGAKIRLEYETEVGNEETMRKVLEALGFKVVRRYQKMREEWELGGVTIALDHTPIGDFVEFEGKGAARVASRCGFEPERAEPRSYLHLYSDYRKDHPDAPADMVFP